MAIELSDLNAFVAVARAKGFRDGARASGTSASGLSEALVQPAGNAASGSPDCSIAPRASVVPTEPGQRLLGAARTPH